MPGGKYASLDNEQDVAGEDIMTVWKKCLSVTLTRTQQLLFRSREK